jgi:hypothetical protein
MVIIPAKNAVLVQNTDRISASGARWPHFRALLAT